LSPEPYGQAGEPAQDRSTSSGSEEVSSAVIASIRGRSRPAIGGVKALLTRPRSLVCAGGSMTRNDLTGWSGCPRFASP